MGLEEVRQEILDNAKNDADGIIKDAETEAKNIVAETEKQIEEYKKRQHSEMRKQTERMERVSISSAKASAKRISLQKKREIIDMAFIKAKKQLIKQRKSEKYIEKLLRRTESEIETNTVYCNRADMGEIKKYQTKEAQIEGIIAENKDGTMRVDMSFDTILDDIKSKFLHEIAEILFKEK